MNQDFIENQELLYRGIHPVLLGDPPNVFSSAAFKQIRDGGISCDRDGERPLDEIITLLKSNVKCGRIVRISAANCRACETEPIPAPLADNPYHAEIYHKNHPLESITKKIGKYLINLAEPVD